MVSVLFQMRSTSEYYVRYRTDGAYKAWPNIVGEVLTLEGPNVSKHPADRRRFVVCDGMGVHLALDDFGTGFSSLS